MHRKTTIPGFVAFGRMRMAYECPRITAFQDDPLISFSDFLPLWEVDLEDNVRGDA